MGHEHFAQPSDELDSQHAPFDPTIIERFGLGPEEVNTVVSYGHYTGTLASVLTDERCPVGSIVAAAYQEKGLAGVEEKFAALSMMSSDFMVEISDKTRGYHDGSVSRDELVASAELPGEPDFLA